MCLSNVNAFDKRVQSLFKCVIKSFVNVMMNAISHSIRRKTHKNDSQYDILHFVYIPTWFFLLHDFAMYTLTFHNHFHGLNNDKCTFSTSMKYNFEIYWQNHCYCSFELHDVRFFVVFFAICEFLRLIYLL